MPPSTIDALGFDIFLLFIYWVRRRFVERWLYPDICLGTSPRGFESNEMCNAERSLYLNLEVFEVNQTSSLLASGDPPHPSDPVEPLQCNQTRSRKRVDPRMARTLQ